MRALSLVLCRLVLLSVAVMQIAAIEPAFRARELLGRDVWSRVLWIKNERPGGHSSYPAGFYGLVFAFEGALWLYTGFDGTQSLSLYRGRLAADQADPGPLLRAIERGLTGFADVTDQVSARADAGTAPLPHDCFLVCMARWRKLQQEMNPPTRARLLAFYFASLPTGHTVLEYWRAGRRYVFDPNTPARLGSFSVEWTEDPMEMARAIFPQHLASEPSKAIAMELRQGGHPPAGPQITVSTARGGGRSAQHPVGGSL